MLWLKSISKNKTKNKTTRKLMSRIWKMCADRDKIWVKQSIAMDHKVPTQKRKANLAIISSTSSDRNLMLFSKHPINKSTK